MPKHTPNPDDLISQAMSLLAKRPRTMTEKALAQRRKAAKKKRPGRKKKGAEPK